MPNALQPPGSTDASTKSLAAVEKAQEHPLEPTMSIAATSESKPRTTDAGRSDGRAEAGPETINPSQIEAFIEQFRTMTLEPSTVSDKDLDYLIDGFAWLRQSPQYRDHVFREMRGIPATAFQPSITNDLASSPPAHTNDTTRIMNKKNLTIPHMPVNDEEQSLRQRTKSSAAEVRNNDHNTAVLKSPVNIRHTNTLQRQAQAQPPTEPGRNSRPSSCVERVKENLVPDEVRQAIEVKWTNGANGANDKEFSHMRYTAATCEPDRFTQQDGYSLRKTDGESRLLIGITAYNEGMVFHARTLHAVIENIRDICKKKSQDPEKSPSLDWKQIHVAIIIDAPLEDESDVVKMYTVLGVYQSSAKMKEVGGERTVAHIFEYTTQLSFDPSSLDLKQPQADDQDNLLPVRIILILKTENRKKIDSHKWLFRAIGGVLKPDVCVLIDVGTKPSIKSIYYLWEAFWSDENLGGACGEIVAMTKGGKKFSNFLVAAQNFEYKMSNILDKPFESSFGNVSVLPGAFSAYRYDAIEGTSGPLDEYFNGDRSLADHGREQNIFTKNMFLAEDRVLCFALVTRVGKRWTSTYVRRSKAETDVPESIAEFIAQRRRWLNGSFAAALYAIFYSKKFLQTSHGKLHKLALFIQALYNFIQILFSWFALANVWLAFSVIIDFPLNLPDHPINKSWHTEILYWLGIVLKGIYLVVLGFQFFFALGNKVKGEKLFYRFTVWIYAVFSIFLIVLSILNALEVIQNQTKNKRTIGDILRSFGLELIISVFATYVINVFASLLLWDAWHMFSSVIQYMLLALSFTNILNVYAFCNLHDVSWGTKGSGDEGKERQKKTDAAREEEKLKKRDTSHHEERQKTTDTAREEERQKKKMDTVRQEERQKKKVDAAREEGRQKKKTDTVRQEERQKKKMDTAGEEKKRKKKTDAAFRGAKGWIEAEKKNILNAKVLREEPTSDDKDRTIRTLISGAWLTSNVILAISIQNGTGLSSGDHKVDQESLQKKQRVYFRIILFSTSVLAVVRFLGCLFYFFQRVLPGYFRGRRNGKVPTRTNRNN